MATSEPISFNRIFAYLPLEGNAADFSEQNNSPTLERAVSYEKKNANVPTAYFNQTGACLAKFPNAWAGRDQYTVAGWAKLSEYRGIDGVQDSLGTLFGGIKVAHKNGELDFNFEAPGGSIRLWSDQRMKENTWTHIALTYDAARHHIQLFMDGHLDMEVDVKILLTEGPPTSPSEYPIGGAEVSTNVSEVLAGSLSQLYFYERVLSNHELQTLAKQNPAEVSAPPISYEDILCYLPLKYSARDYSGSYNTPTAMHVTFEHAHASTQPVASFLEPGATIQDFPKGPESCMELSTAAWVCLNGFKDPPADDPRQFFSSVIGGIEILCTNGEAWARMETPITNGTAISGCAGGYGGDLSVGVWTHLAMTFSQADRKIILYVNGEEQAYQDFGLTSDNPGNSPLYYPIGGAYSLEGMVGSQFNGYIAEVYEFARKLSPEEIQTLASDRMAPVN